MQGDSSVTVLCCTLVICVSPNSGSGKRLESPIWVPSGQSLILHGGGWRDGWGSAVAG